ncbi:MAG: hypothetical protein RR335_10605 [Eubacterium sp.]
MKSIHACLVGNWVNLCNDPECKIGEDRTSPLIWWEENAEIYAPSSRNKKSENSMYSLDYVHIYYKGADYRINPMFIQVVTTKDY